MKKILLGMILTASTAIAVAAPVTVTISVQGANFQDIWEPEPIWSPSASLVISFTGEDLNNDQIITANELTHLNGYGHDYVGPNGPNELHRIHEFRFHSATDYTIDCTYGDSYYYDHFDLGTAPNDGRTWGWSNDAGFQHDWYITDQSTISVVSSVPEPSGIAMSALGFGLIGLLARRWHRATQQ
jgi:hypothetical protein